jgi:putative protein-disulfide isomerase
MVTPLSQAGAPTLHYIYDPLCGWCYGAAPLIQAARKVLTVRTHGGGMMVGANRQPVSAQLRQYVMQHDRRIAQLTGQLFGDAYFNGLLLDTNAVLDSAPPIAAILAAEALANKGLDMLAHLQTAHYVEGQRIADQDVLLDQAENIGLDPVAFAIALANASGADVLNHIAETRALMASARVQGFPSLLLEHHGHMEPIAISPYLGQPETFANLLREHEAVKAPQNAHA